MVTGREYSYGCPHHLTIYIDIRADVRVELSVLRTVRPRPPSLEGVTYSMNAPSGSLNLFITYSPLSMGLVSTVVQAYGYHSRGRGRM